MATRLYINNYAPVFIPATLKGAWDSVPSSRAFMMGMSKFGDNNAEFHEGETNIAAPFSTILLRGISSALKTQTITGHVDVIFAIRESAADADFFWKLHIYVTQGDTDLVRGTLLNNYTENGTNEWPTGGISGGGPNAIGLQAPTNLGSVNAISGDRLVVEIGFVSRNVLTAYREGGIVIGTQTGVLNEAAPDLVVGDIGQAYAKAGSINFDQTILFEDVPETLVHVVTQAAESVGAAANLSHVITQAAETAPAGSWISHLIVQVAEGSPLPLLDVSGVFFINPKKAQRHDTYYSNQQRKIPNPTIRTALLGE